MKKTLIIGGSFDPVHNGHIQIALHTQKILNADKVVFLIAKSPRWKVTSATDFVRLNMLKIALKEYNSFEISLLEINSNDEINYTYKTLLKYPKEDDEEVYFLFGYDQLEQLDKWYEIDKLSKLVHLVSFGRPTYKINKDFVEKYNVQLIDMEVSSTSSSAIRELLSADTSLEVLDYIAEHELYYIKDVQSFFSKKRYLHSLSVARTAYIIAKGNNLDVSKAYIAGLLHDIGKEIPIEEQKEFLIKTYGDKYLNIQKPLYHQFMSKELAYKHFKITDEEILDAIEIHATGASKMTKLAKILYAADKIEPTRGYDSSELIELCSKDIDEGFKRVLKENIQYFIENNIDYDNILTNGCINKYLKGD